MATTFAQFRDSLADPSARDALGIRISDAEAQRAFDDVALARSLFVQWREVEESIPLPAASDAAIESGASKTAQDDSGQSPPSRSGRLFVAFLGVCATFVASYMAVSLAAFVTPAFWTWGREPTVIEWIIRGIYLAAPFVITVLVGRSLYRWARRQEPRKAGDSPASDPGEQ
ncbi:hypothetical protein [Microbacterium sp. SS28]|uniref:hypothetical protein n=1 Tax=Microbacterium sp. SS28 TaxID=2919948 RepID=UPI001FAA7CB3|nr:hypothetical protein [Microbacterium sp. SS28]